MLHINMLTSRIVYLSAGDIQKEINILDEIQTMQNYHNKARHQKNANCTPRGTKHLQRHVNYPKKQRVSLKKHKLFTIDRAAWFVIVLCLTPVPGDNNRANCVTNVRKAKFRFY